MSDAILEPTAGSPDMSDTQTPAEEALARLKELHPDVVSDETREGYEGLIVYADSITEVARTLRDEFGFNYLSSVTGVDNIDAGKLEAVYHFYSISRGGGALILKAQTDRENPVIPSLVPIFPGADFQEREAFDMYGIRFTGHPDLRRILTWDGFDGFPLRKDWKEAFYEEDYKPFGSRWPEGRVFGQRNEIPTVKMSATLPVGHRPGMNTMWRQTFTWVFPTPAMRHLALKPIK
jgi:NADH-quinone oxidoreductase subunit C/D